MNEMKQPESIDEYIVGFPGNVQLILQQFRQAIKQAAPAAKEIINYKMPAFELNGILVWFAAFKNHMVFTRKFQRWKPSKIN